MDPLFLTALLAAGAEGVQQAGKIIPSKFDKEQQKRLEELKRREEIGLLGLTEQERNVLESRMQGRSQQAQARSDAERNRLLAAQGVTSGQALQQATQVEEVRGRQEAAVQQAIEEQDIREKQREEEELRALEAAVAQDTAESRQALANVASTGFDSFITSSAPAQLAQATQVASPEAVADIAQRYGISEDKARGILEYNAKNGTDTSEYYEHMGWEMP